MSQQSEHFNFDNFDEQIADALVQNESAMRRIFPGQIGGVACRPTLVELPEPEQPQSPEEPRGF